MGKEKTNDITLTATYTGSHSIGGVLYKFSKGEAVDIQNKHLSGMKTLFDEHNQ